MARTRITPRQKRHGRVRARISGTAARPRLSVFRSAKHIWAQVIDDVTGHTLAAASDTEGKSKVAKMTRAFETGKALAQKALAIGIKAVVFDRGGYKYQGRVKALAEGARKGGLKF